MSVGHRIAIIRLSADRLRHSRRLDDDYLSLTIDTSLLLGGHWWGTEKKIRNGVAGESTPALDLKNPRLRAYASALSPAMLRIGGTEADRLRYKMGKKAAAASGFQPPAEGTEEETGISHEFVLRKGLWKRLHEFLSETGLSLLFTLSAGPADRDAEGNWKEDNARKLIAYSHRKGFPVAAWELGNEVNAYPFIHGLAHRVSPSRYAADFERLGRLARALDPDAKLVGPASAVWPRIGEPNPLIRALCASPAAPFLDAVSWHYYPQQSSYGRVATRRATEGNMLSPRRLDEAQRRNARVRASIELATKYRPMGEPIQNWVTETAHALYGGEPGLSDSFVSTLWWLDELGLLAREGATKVFRQALVGARYGLLDQDSMDPRPDYYASFLWKKLMGNLVVTERPGVEVDRKLRLYVHVDKKTASWTVLAINLSRKRSARIAIELPATPEAPPAASSAVTYLLQGDGAFTSRTMLLNRMRVTDDLVFSWGRKSVRDKYRLKATPLPRRDGVAYIEEEAPPLSALFISVAADRRGDRSRRAP